MKKFLFLALVVGLSVAIGQAQTVVQATPVAVDDAAPNPNPNLGSRDPGDFLFDLDMETLTGDIRLLGVECDDTYWYMTGARDYQGCYFYQVDLAGTTVINQVATGHSGWGWRDLGYDGTYLYASDSYSLEQIDPATGTPTGLTISGPISPCRAVAYDPATDTFWTASFSSPIYQFDRSGTVLKTVSNPGLSLYGAAIEETQNILWWWSQDGSGTLCTGMDPATGNLTGDQWDGGSGTWPGIAGGACVYTDPTHGIVFAGMHQASPDNVAVYKILPNPNPQLDIKVNGQDFLVVVPQGTNAKITIDIEARQGAGIPVDVWVVLKTPFGFFSYDGAGPYSGWNMGLNNAAFTGPLADMNATVLDQPLPIGTYKAYLGLDSVPDGKLTMSAIFPGTDNVDFWVM